jgi:hypothetical protein
VAAAGRPIEFVAAPTDIEGALAATPAALVLIDLSRPGALDALTTVAAKGTVRILAFGSHVDRDLLTAGRATGAE